MRSQVVQVALGAIAIWSHNEHNPALEHSPRITRTPDGSPCDPLDVGLIGSEEELRRAMSDAGWSVAASLGVRSDFFLFGRKPDVAFEKEAGRSVGLSRRTGQITQHIAADIDSDRDALFAGLAATGRLVREYPVTGIGETLRGRNGGATAASPTASSGSERSRRATRGARRRPSSSRFLRRSR